MSALTFAVAHVCVCAWVRMCMHGNACVHVHVCVCVCVYRSVAQALRQLVQRVHLCLSIVNIGDKRAPGLTKRECAPDMCHMESALKSK